MNQFNVTGNLTRDIELRYTQSGSGIANTAIATSRKFTQNGEKKEEVCFIDLTLSSPSPYSTATTSPERVQTAGETTK